MRRALTIAVAQPCIDAHAVATNARRHAAMVAAAEADVVVFPELSLTGYELDAEPIDPADERLAPIVDACAASDSVALVGAPVTAPARGRNIATLAIDARGVSVAYRKMWLGDEESDRFVAGERPAVIDHTGWRLGLAICKDTGVAEHAVATTALGCHLYVAGVLEADADADVVPERAQTIARRHRVWVAVASYAGSTGGGYHLAAGGSGIWRPDGSVAALAGTAVGELACATLRPDTVELTAGSAR